MAGLEHRRDFWRMALLRSTLSPAVEYDPGARPAARCSLVAGDELCVVSIEGNCRCMSQGHLSINGIRHATVSIDFLRFTLRAGANTSSYRGRPRASGRHLPGGQGSSNGIDACCRDRMAASTICA